MIHYNNLISIPLTTVFLDDLSWDPLSSVHCHHHRNYNACFKAVVNTVGGLLASRRVFSWLPLGFFCSYSTDSDLITSLNTRIKKNLVTFAAVYQ